MITGTVSIIIPFYSAPEFLEESIKSAFAQNNIETEVILVDDHSPAPPLKILEKFPQLKLLRLERNFGPSYARNRGVTIAKGEFIIFLDADDVLLPAAALIGIGKLALKPNLGAVAGTFSDIDFKGDIIREPEAEEQDEEISYGSMLRANRIASPAITVVRKSVHLAVGGFNEALRVAEDYDYFLKIADRHGLARHSERVAKVRKHRNQKTCDSRQMLSGCVDLLSQHAKAISSSRKGAQRGQLLRDVSAGKREIQRIFGERLVIDLGTSLELKKTLPRSKAYNTLLRYYLPGFLRLCSPSLLLTWRWLNDRIPFMFSPCALSFALNPHDRHPLYDELFAGTLSWTGPSDSEYVVRINGVDGSEFCRHKDCGSQKTGHWIVDGLQFFLLRDGNLTARKTVTILPSLLYQKSPPNNRQIQLEEV